MRIGDDFLDDNTHIFPLLETEIFVVTFLCAVEEHGGLTGNDRLTDFAPGRGLKSGGIARLQYEDNFAAL